MFNWYLLFGSRIKQAGDDLAANVKIVSGILILTSSLCCSFDPSLSYEEREKRMKQVSGRVGFVQDLLLSTLLSN